MRLPSDLEIRSLHERFAPDPIAFDLVHTHCAIVAEIAAQLIVRNRLAVDADLVRAGCLLHDIGVYRLYGPDGSLEHANYIRHGVLGHELLSDLGFSDRLGRFCSCHTGVGITRDDVERQSLSLPPADYVAESAEERLVMYADKFHTKSVPPRFLTADGYRSEIARFGPGKAAAFDRMVATYGEPDLEGLSAEHGHVLH